MSKLRTPAVRLSAVVLAMIASLAVWIVAEAIIGTDLRAPAQGGGGETQDVNAGVVATASLVASMAGWGLLEVLERLTARARRIWITVALLVLIVSFGGPLSATGINAANKAWLAAMHLAVGAVLIPLLSRTVGRRGDKAAPDLTRQTA